MNASEYVSGYTVVVLGEIGATEDNYLDYTLKYLDAVVHYSAQAL